MSVTVCKTHERSRLEHRTQQRRVVFLWIKEAKLNLELFLCTLRLFQWDVFRRIIRFVLALLIISPPSSSSSSSSSSSGCAACSSTFRLLTMLVVKKCLLHIPRYERELGGHHPGGRDGAAIIPQ